MGGLFGGGKSVKPPPVEPVEPPPAVDESRQAGEQVRKRKKGSRQATFLTGDLIPTVDANSNLNKKTLG